jgi:addiction module HigA family antidote
MPIKPHASFALHPGPWIKRNILAPYAMTVTQAAEHLGISRPPFSNVLNGKAALSPELAARIERAFGVSARTLLNMQAAHSLAATEGRQDIAAIRRLPKPALKAA